VRFWPLHSKLCIQCLPLSRVVANVPPAQLTSEYEERMLILRVSDWAWSGLFFVRP